MEAGLDGVVCSIRGRKSTQYVEKKFLTITPGVRFADGDGRRSEACDNTCKKQKSLALILS